MTRRSISAAILVGAMLLALVLTFSVRSQDDDSKAIKAEVFIKRRPSEGARPPSKAKYRADSKSSKSVDPKQMTGMVVNEVGLTIWRFRPASESDKTKELVEVADDQQWVLERIAEGTPLSPGQKVRLSFESLSTTGYLYIVNREEFADGTFGVPKLIFPTRKSLNRYKVEPGRLIYIPSASSKFEIIPSDSTKTHVGESLSIIISPKPLIDDSQLQSQAITLSQKQFDQWLNEWKAKIEKFEMEGGIGQTLTQSEKVAANLNAPLLSQADPVPQTVYQLTAKPEQPLLIALPLRFTR